MPAKPIPKRAKPELTDNPFLEGVFATMCEHLEPLPGDNFVTQVRRWMDALYFTAKLKPRTERDWHNAADVTVAQYAAVWSGAMQKRAGIPADLRAKHGQELIIRTMKWLEAKRHYDLLRNSKAA